MTVFSLHFQRFSILQMAIIGLQEISVEMDFFVSKTERDRAIITISAVNTEEIHGQVCWKAFFEASNHFIVNSAVPVCSWQFSEMCRIDWNSQNKSLWITRFVCMKTNTQTSTNALHSHGAYGFVFLSWNNQDSHHSSRTDSICLHFCILGKCSRLPNVFISSLQI